MSEPTTIVRFSTKLNGYQVPTSNYDVPLSLTRLGLSKLINTLLQLETHIPFDFIVNGDFLRKTLGEHLTERDMSKEAVTEIEYTVALPAPEETWENDEKNWITCLRGVNGYLFSGNNISQITATQVSGKEIGQINWMTSPKFVKSISVSHANSHVGIAACGKSNTITIYAFENETFHEESILKGHTGSVESVCYSPDGQHLVSGSWDSTVNIWDLQNYNTPVQTSPLRTKSATKTVTAYMPITGHSQAVTKVLWPVEAQLFSSSLDGSIALWDASNGSMISAYKPGKTTLCLDYSTNNNLLLSGHNDCIIRISDPRQKNVAMKLMKSHVAMVQDVQWHPLSPYLFASAAFDYSIKVWDIRSVTPLCTIPLKGKGTAVCWNEKGDEFYSASSYGRLAAHRFTHN
ncbi:WD repeat-containing protein, putative [Entamoeba invadens IP1]|uniref:WD repeat-containing protein, putative n=1 Tax=Entamoeba invadens IP1 TaxID=370355 RepID=A0A0A1UAH0_ENTIV|nr:WD repeat-containing protein, putative [Entamoeba invadens IP1]ELP91990.1 WD repeat-containing protein, putative [Entamoeba invadens IP1]|eukprot:XP_004258761.1 WD repeat-containing protein, putative [Entamoeba invadens IP1]